MIEARGIGNGSRRKKDAPEKGAPRLLPGKLLFRLSADFKLPVLITEPGTLKEHRRVFPGQDSTVTFVFSVRMPYRDGKICFDSICFFYECKVFFRTFLALTENAKLYTAVCFCQFCAVKQ